MDFVYKSVCSEHSGILKLIPGLEKQYAVVLGEAFSSPEIVKIAEANPTPNSNDPKVIQSWLESGTAQSNETMN